MTEAKDHNDHSQPTDAYQTFHYQTLVKEIFDQMPHYRAPLYFAGYFSCSRHLLDSKTVKSLHFSLRARALRPVTECLNQVHTADDGIDLFPHLLGLHYLGG